MKRPSATAVVGLVALAGGVLAGLAIRSPDQARLPEPEPIVLTAPIEARSLDQDLTVTGEVVPAATTEVVVSPPADRQGVISALPIGEGEEVVMCAPLIEVSGRAVLALPGPVRSYRDLTVGDSGPDVRQLQEALGSCGYPVGVDGAFGSETARALTKLLKANAIAPSMVDSPPPAVVPEPEADDPPVDAEDSETDREVPAHPAPPRQQVSLPAAEVAYLPAPGRAVGVLPLDTVVGAEPVMRVTSTSMTATFRLTPAEYGLLDGSEQATVSIASHTETLPLPAGQSVLDPTTGAASYDIAFPLSPDAPAAAEGGTASLSITVGDGQVYEHVVPVSALNLDSNGDYYIEIAPATSEAKASRVAVTQVATGGGYVAIDPDGDVLAGDRAIIGVEQP